jgi:hypothetical protein
LLSKNNAVWVITFPSVYHAFRAEKILQQKGIGVKLIPIPRELSGSCEGLAAEVGEEDVASAVACLAENGVKMVREGVAITKR